MSRMPQLRQSDVPRHADSVLMGIMEAVLGRGVLALDYIRADGCNCRISKEIPMAVVFEFGEQMDGIPVRVVNERAVRAAAGLLFVPAFVAFMNAILLGNFQPTRVFIVLFLVDMAVRLFINPRWSPSLIAGQWIVRSQQPEWVGAPQKRFAWGLGLLLAIAMFFLMVVNQVIGPINMLVCGTCLVLMFFEAAFGICLGCKLYNLFNREAAQLCPGGACAIPAKDVKGLGWAQRLVLLGFAGLIVVTSQWVRSTAPARAPVANAPLAAPQDAAEAERCKVPEFAKAIGHEAQWKLHNHCP